MTLGRTSFILTGAAEEQVWNSIARYIVKGKKFFKVPNHGSVNATFNKAGNPSWLNECRRDTILGISTHVRPFEHPHKQVIDLFEKKRMKVLRTDQNYHLTITSDGNSFDCKYSHF